jgi:chromosome segregation ATPase
MSATIRINIEDEEGNGVNEEFTFHQPSRENKSDEIEELEASLRHACGSTDTARELNNVLREKLEEVRKELKLQRGRREAENLHYNDDREKAEDELNTCRELNEVLKEKNFDLTTTVNDCSQKIHGLEAERERLVSNSEVAMIEVINSRAEVRSKLRKAEACIRNAQEAAEGGNVFCTALDLDGYLDLVDGRGDSPAVKGVRARIITERTRQVPD